MRRTPMVVLGIVLGCAFGSAWAADVVADAKKVIAEQVEVLKSGDLEKVKACFTARLQDRITKEVVEAGKAEAAKYTIDDLVASAEAGEHEGKKTIKIKMKNGRSLTTLVQTDGKWLADTIWFK